MKHNYSSCLTCDDCPNKHWITGKDYLLSKIDKQPTILECHVDHERIVRGTPACDKHPDYKKNKSKRK